MLPYEFNQRRTNHQHSDSWREKTLEKEIKRLKKEKEDIEKISYDLMESIKIYKSTTWTNKQKKKLSERHIKSEKRRIKELVNRHRNISSRILNLEWDNCNIEKVIRKKCKWDDCNCRKINLIRFPSYYTHYAKEECSECGRWQKFIPEST
tara:strand:+ start:1047 stop:1499 length:453 start_codon:yes stop_codon:yes gene_type:complete